MTEQETFDAAVAKIAIVYDRQKDELMSELRRWKMLVFASFVIGVLVGATVL